MTQRLFIAIPLPDGIKTELANYKRYFTLPNLRWIPESNWHITVLFLGDVEEEKITIISERLKEVAKQTREFALRLQDVVLGSASVPQYCGTSAGKPPHKLNMIWAVFRRQWEFEQLAKKVREALADLLPIDYSHQEQIAHVTMARIKVFLDSRLRGNDRKIRQQAPEVKAINFEVDKILLMESELKPEGANYTRLQDFKLSSLQAR